MNCQTCTTNIDLARFGRIIFAVGTMVTIEAACPKCGLTNGMDFIGGARYRRPQPTTQNPNPMRKAAR